MKRIFFTLFLACLLPYSIKSTTTCATEQVIDVVPAEQQIMHDMINQLNSSTLTSTQALLCFERLMGWAVTTQQNPEYVDEALELFHNNVKRFDFVNAAVLSHILPNFTKQCSTYLKPTAQQVSPLWYDETLFDTFTASIRSTLILGFNTDFEQFKKSPDSFINQLSRQIAQQAQKEHNIALLRSNIVSFLELTIGKLIWSPHEGEKSWESVKKLSTQLAQLVEADVIDSVNSLDKLLWSLTHRFCLFIELTGSVLSDAFYQQVATDLAHKKLLLVALEEQHPSMKTKAAYITDALAKGYTAAHAHKESVI